MNALVRARLAEEGGEPAAALSALTAVSSVAPDLPGLRGRMLEQAIEAGDLEAARAAALRLWTAGDRRFDAQLVLMVDAMRRSDWKAARDYAAGRIDKAGADTIGRLILPTVNAWIDVGSREKMPEQHLLAVNSRTRPEPALTLQVALVQIATKRVGEAATLTDRITLTDRTSQLVGLRVAATLDKAGQQDTAQRLRGRIALASGQREDPMLLLPDQPVSTPQAGVAQWLGLLADGLARTPGGSAKLPLLFARAAYWLNAEDLAVRTTLVEALDRNGQRGDAMALLETVRAPLPPVLAMRRAELMADAGDLPGAAKLAEAAAKDNDARSMLVRLADIARRSGDPAAAARAYERLEASLGNSGGDNMLRGTLLIARAELLLQAGRWDAAAPLMEKAVALRPDDASILNFAGYSALERRKDVKQSLARIEAAWAQEPQNASIADSLGWAYFLTGRTDDAVKLLEKAQLGEPGNAVIVEHLGDAYWKAGQKFQARYNWRAAALLAEAEMATRLEAKLRDGLTPATTAP
ncbi:MULTISPECIES: tetratricopeptide repeat protein [unclassified Sphingopyxis]|uniref:tetratricopeptide repeat protein n=1 Tax=unclassified Sphingopyxis TaxID=2614943 RepID=UPI00286037FE|nr:MULTISPECIES: tetratricopeptide repeat protein [unclassified Sphingopyxis]MDR7059934.1 tetratricopeptide (TPR) repeat protein [Sphingopyxis sp. BE235]MDR7180554.1 tetratricopeptide (TPR) repeat protein [Sphingopyxis sp. BE249]